MSVPVTLAELPAQIERFGCNPYLVTVGTNAQPRASRGAPAACAVTAANRFAT